MTLNNITAFLCRELTEGIAQMLSQSGIECLASAFPDKENVKFAVPIRVIEAPIRTLGCSCSRVHGRPRKERGDGLP
jgi:hypothetical protein